jgi:hypothetical protein
MTKTVSAKAQDKVKRAVQRDARRKKRTLVKLEQQNTEKVPVSTGRYTVPTIGEEMTSNFTDIIEDKITIPMNCDVQTDPVLCVNCDERPFDLKPNTTPVDNLCQTEGDPLSELEIIKHENERLRKEIRFYQTQAMDTLGKITWPGK